jgi:hypothetical protein
MRMLHIRNMHQLASAAISPLHEDSPARRPRPRLVGSRKPGADHRLSSTTRFLPYLHYFHYFPLPATSTPAHPLVIGPPPGLPARPGKRPERRDSHASLLCTNFPEHETAVSAPSSESVFSVLDSCSSSSPLSRNRSAASAVEIDPSKIHPIGENSPLRRSANYICRPFRHDFPRSSDLLPYVHLPYSPLTPALM